MASIQTQIPRGEGDYCAQMFGQSRAQFNEPKRVFDVAKQVSFLVCTS